MRVSPQMKRMRGNACRGIGLNVPDDVGVCCSVVAVEDDDGEEELELEAGVPDVVVAPSSVEGVRSGGMASPDIASWLPVEHSPEASMHPCDTSVAGSGSMI